jgi:Na+/H+ antiporter NhaD/arsenite permease-like protein
MTGLARTLSVFLITVGAALLSINYGFNFRQTVSVAVFILVISAALFFWEFHLPIAFAGISILMICGIMDMPSLVAESKLDIILFLVAMMIIVGILKDLGLFSWIIITVITIPGMTARMFVVIACAIGAAMSCMADETSSIVFISALIFQVCDTLNLRPVPFIVMAIMAINIGSAGTMLGNPIGILIGQNASPPLSFNDFMLWSFPLMLAEFAAVMFFMLWNFRREIREMETKLTERRNMGLSLGPIVKVPYGRGLLVLAVLMTLLSIHTVIEARLGLARNVMLITIPLLVAGLLMLWRRENIRKHVESDVDWMTLIFFMMLFVVAGTLRRTEATNIIADGFVATFRNTPSLMLPTIIGVTALGSAFIENIIFVAAFLPIVARLEQMPLFWALLHGACLGGNITMIGSTANIVAVSMLEKRYWTRMDFLVWLRTGLAVGVISCMVAWGGLALLSPYMPAQTAARFAAAAKGTKRTTPNQGSRPDRTNAIL